MLWRILKLLLDIAYKHALRKWKKPSFIKVSLLIDSKCGLLKSPEKAKHFDYWIRLSTKEKGKPTHLPAKLHGYFHSKDGELSGLIQISENCRVRFVKEVAVKSLEFSRGVALDFGMDQKSRNMQRRLTNFKETYKDRR